MRNPAPGTALLILALILILGGSCTERKSKLPDNNLIPKKELISLLVDLHIADGLLSLPKINARSSSLDSITSYIQVIEKHGYTKEDMDRTMKYYFINKPKDLNKIYDQVLGILSDMESRVQKLALAEASRSMNQWPGRESYVFPGIHGSDSTKFETTLTRAGFYTLSFTAVLFPDDQSVTPRTVIYSCSPDSIETGKRKYFSSIQFIKDGRQHDYHIPIQVNDKNLHVGGWLINNNTRPTQVFRHLFIDNISIGYTSDVAL
jgi:hypothetical protein